MDTYDLLRRFADSWGLLAMVLFFLIVLLRAFSPWRGREMREAAAIPLDERTPKDFERDRAAAARAGDERGGRQ